MNGQPIIGATPKLTQDQIAICDVLKEALALALEGKVYTAGVILCLENGFASTMAGRQAGDLNLGCDDMKTKILAAVLHGTEERQTRRSSPLIKPGRA